jgi:hypothetical protein
MQRVRARRCTVLVSRRHAALVQDVGTSQFWAFDWSIGCRGASEVSCVGERWRLCHRPHHAHHVSTCKNQPLSSYLCFVSKTAAIALQYVFFLPSFFCPSQVLWCAGQALSSFPSFYAPTAMLSHLSTTLTSTDLCSRSISCVIIAQKRCCEFWAGLRQAGGLGGWSGGAAPHGFGSTAWQIGGQPPAVSLSYSLHRFASGIVHRKQL